MELSTDLVDIRVDVGASYYTTKPQRLFEVYPIEEQAAIQKVIGEREDAFVQEVGYDRRAKPQRCPHCGHKRKISWVGLAKPRWVWYLNVMNVPLVLGFEAGRWECETCKKCYTDYPENVMAYSRHSLLMLFHILDALRRQSISWVCRQYHIDEKTLANMLLKHVDLTPNWKDLLRWPELHLVVDEHSFAGKQLVITVCEAMSRQVLAILRDGRVASLKAFLKSIPADVKLRITHGATDLKAGYRNALLAWKQELVLSADPFHVVRLGNQLVEEERRFQQAQMRQQMREAVIPAGPLRAAGERIKASTRSLRREILEAHPTLACAYRLKEQLRAMYLARDPVAARLLLEQLQLDLQQAINDSALLGMRAELQRFRRTLQRWQKQILAYFDSWLSTAMVEGFHTTIKLIKRISYGFRNVDRYRAKVMLGLGATITLRHPSMSRTAYPRAA